MELMMSSNDTAVDPAAQTVRLSGKATVAGAVDLKRVLVEALDSADEVILDVSGITTCDPSFFQLLCAAHQSSAVLGKMLGVGPDGLGGLRNLAKLSGCYPASGCGRVQGGCLLQKEEDK
ncbi:MAG: STAS domain-containing protein [Desulfuromonadales bacterium]|nr:STAS domain-containing protein [Desulfuromonadales bacterium]